MRTTVRARIIAAEDVMHPLPGFPGLSAAERTVAKHAPDFMEVPRTTSSKAVAYTHVSWGRWSVRCPWCPSSQYASRADHRFFCVECGNAAVDGQWVEVLWPADAAGIEEALGERVDPATRTWVWGETAEDAFAENERRGVYSAEPGSRVLLTPAQALLAAAVELNPEILNLLPPGFVPPELKKEGD